MGRSKLEYWKRKEIEIEKKLSSLILHKPKKEIKPPEIENRGHLRLVIAVVISLLLVGIISFLGLNNVTSLTSEFTNNKNLITGAEIIGVSADISVLNAGNSTGFVAINPLVDSTPPNITNLIPTVGSTYNVSDRIQIGANVTDDVIVDTVSANITYPNGSIISFTLANGTDYKTKFNVSFNSTVAGNYTVQFVANDTSNNINNTLKTWFEIDYNLTFINDTLKYGYIDGTRDNLLFNGSIGALQLKDFTKNGSFLSRVFAADTTADWKNISWISNARELPASQASDASINMTGNMLLFRFNNDSSVGENLTHLYDYSRGWKNATIYASPLINLTNKKFGAGGLECDGSTDYAATIQNLAFIENFSATAWVYPKTNTFFERIVATDFDNHFFLGVNNSGGRYKWIVKSPDSPYGTVEGGTVTKGKWQFVAGTYNGTHGVLYVDGVKVSTGAMTNPGPTSIQVYVGRRGTSSKAFWNGTIDEVAVWNRTLTDDDVKALYERGITRLNLSVRSCDDAACDTETWTYLNYTEPQTLSLNYNQYFQYNFSFETENVSYTPELYNVSVSYEMPLIPPNVTNLIPSNNSAFNITNAIEIGVNISEGGITDQVLANISHPNGSTQLLTLSNGTNFKTKFNVSWTTPELAGLYNITFIANDTDNNRNTSEKIFFNVNISCAIITKDTNLDQDVVDGSTCFNISANHISLNCSGHTIRYGTAGSGYGINISNFDNITIKNCVIRKGSTSGSSTYGVYLSGSENSTIRNNSIFTDGASNNHGVYIYGKSNQTIIANNTISTNGSSQNNYGISIDDSSSQNTIENNTIYTKGTMGDHGVIVLTGGGNANRIINNNIYAGNLGSGNTGITLSKENHTVRGNIIYTNGSGSCHGIDLSTSAKNVTIINNSIFSNSSSNQNYGIRVQGDLCTVRGNNILTNGTDTNYGAFLSFAYNNTVENNSISTRGTGGNNFGIYISGDYNTLRNNTIKTNGTTNNYGVYLYTTPNGCVGNYLDNNNVVSDGTSGSYALYIANADNENNTFVNNNLTSLTNDLEIRDDTSLSFLNYLIYNNSWGEIEWIANSSGSFLGNMTLNVTNSLGLGLGRNIFIGNNSFALNTSAFNIGLGRVNGTANIILKGLDLDSVNQIVFLTNYTTNSTVIRNVGANCTSCTNISYSGGVLVFNTSSFSSFAGNKTSFSEVSAETPSTGGGGGGGTSSATCPSGYEKVDGKCTLVEEEVAEGSLSVSLKNIVQNLFAGDSSVKYLSIINTFDRDIDVVLHLHGDVADILEVESETEVVTVSALSSRNIYLEFDASDIEAGVYSGEIVLFSGTGDITIPILVTIRDRDDRPKKIFDVDITWHSGIVNPGGDLNFILDIMNFGSDLGFDVNVIQRLVDLKTGEVIDRKKEAVKIDTRASISSSLSVLEDIADGEYKLEVVVFVDDVKAVSEAFFMVKSGDVVEGKMPIFGQALGDIREFFSPGVLLMFLILVALIVGGLFAMKRYFRGEKKVYRVEQKVNRFPRTVRQQEVPKDNLTEMGYCRERQV